MRCWSLRSMLRLAALAAVLPLLPASPARAQGPPTPGLEATARAEHEIRQLVTRYYEAYTRKDLAALETCWHPKGPGRYARNVMEVEFELRDATLRSVSLRDFSVDAGGGRARAVVEMAVTERKSGRTRTERRVREMTFLQDEAGWKVWNEASSAMLLSRRLLSVPAEERAALLAAEPELASDDTLTGLGLETNRLRTQGGMTATLDAIAAREQVARALNNEHALASSLLDSGLMFQVMGRIDEAGKAFAEARDLFARAGTRIEVANLDANLAAVDYLAGRYPSALTRFQQALDVFEAAGNQARTASLLHGIGNTLYMQGQFERALDSYGRTFTMTEAAGNKAGSSAALLAIALVHKELGNYTQAGEAYSRSAALSAVTGDHTGAAKALHGQGEVHRLQGDHALALQAFHRALDAWARTMDPPSRAATLFAIGQVHAAERSFATAVEWYQKALDVDTGANASAGIARDTGGLAGAHFAMGQTDVALGEYERSLALREALQDTPGVTWTLIHMGVLHVSQGRLDEALAVYMRAIGIAEKAGDQPALGVAHALKASAELAGGVPGRALESVAQALLFAGRSEQFDAIAFARTIEGKVHGEGGRTAEARQAFEQAIAAVAKVPTGPGADTFFTDRRGPYLALADLLIRAGESAAALDWLERGRQHTLAALLGGDGAIVTKGLSTTERDEEQALARAVRSAAVKLRRERGRTAPDPGRESALREEVAKAVAQRDDVRTRLFAAHPDLPVFRAQSEPVPVATLLPALLRPGEAVLTFAVTDLRTHVLVARAPQPAPGDASGAAATGVTTATPPLSVYAASLDVAGTDLAARVARFRQALRALDPGADALSSDLYSLLLLPVESHLAGLSRLLVVPDAMLWDLPFEALRAPSRRYLVERAAVSYAPSLTAWSVATRAAAAGKGTGRIFALGGPAISKAAEERAGLLRPGLKLDTAGSTEREARAVVALAGPARGQAVLGAKATVERLANGVPAGAMAHVAAPLVLSDASPLHSWLVLSPSGDQETGLSEIGHALGWEVPAAAAVFPAVEAPGAGGSGEALAALSWSMLVAGTPAIVVSRWPLGARPPARLDPLVAGFYRAQLAVTAPGAPGFAASLQRAARRLIAAPATRHPGRWAGLDGHGEVEENSVLPRLDGRRIRPIEDPSEQENHQPGFGDQDG